MNDLIGNGLLAKRAERRRWNFRLSAVLKEIDAYIFSDEQERKLRRKIMEKIKNLREPKRNGGRL